MNFDSITGFIFTLVEVVLHVTIEVGDTQHMLVLALLHSPQAPCCLQLSLTSCLRSFSLRMSNRINDRQASVINNRSSSQYNRVASFLRTSQRMSDLRDVDIIQGHKMQVNSVILISSHSHLKHKIKRRSQNST